MGTYIQVGVCLEIRVARGELSRTGLSHDEVTRLISARYVDLSLFAQQEDQHWIRWVLPEELVEQGLVPFLSAQFALLAGGRDDRGTDVVQELERVTSYAGIVELARSKSLVDFQSSSIDEYLPREDGPRVSAEVLDFLIEGRAIMEGRDRLFNYLRGLIRMQRAAHPIAGAVVVFLG